MEHEHKRLSGFGWFLKSQESTALGLRWIAVGTLLILVFPITGISAMEGSVWIRTVAVIAFVAGTVVLARGLMYLKATDCH